MIFIYFLILITPFAQYPLFYSLFPSLSLVKIVGLISFLYSLFYWQKNEHSRVLGSKLEWFVCLYFSYSLVRLMLDGAFLEVSLFQTLMSFLVFYYVCVKCIDSHHKIRHAMYCIIIGMSLAAYRGFKEFLFLGYSRPESVFGDPNYFAIALAMTIFILLSFILYGGRKKYQKKLLSFLCCLLILLLVITGSRGGILGFMVGIIFVVKDIKNRRGRFVVLISLSLILLLPFVPQSVMNRMSLSSMTETESAVEIEDGLHGARISAHARKELFFAGLEMFKDKPLFGVGPGKFKEKSELYNPNVLSPQIAHCTWVEVLAEQGALGLGLLLTILVLTMRRLRSIISLEVLKDKSELLVLANGLKFGIIVYCCSATFLSAGWEKFFWVLIFLSICLNNSIEYLKEENLN